MTDQAHLDLLRELNEYEPGGFVAIGGVALHLYQRASGIPPHKPIHDLDVFVTWLGMDTATALYEVHRNPRLGKASFKAGPVSGDLYIERQHDLGLDNDSFVKNSWIIDGIRVLHPVHYLALKLDAVSAGRKHPDDAADLVRFFETDAGRQLPPLMLAKVMTPARCEALRTLIHDPMICMAVTGDSMTARAQAENLRGTIAAITGEEAPSGILPSKQQYEASRWTSLDGGIA